MVIKIQPDPRHIIEAAWNRKPRRMPIYEHIINVRFMERVTGASFGSPGGNIGERAAFFRRYTAFFLDMGYDAVSFETGATGALPGGGALGKHAAPAIRDREDFDRYPWADLPKLFEERAWPLFAAAEETLPPGMLLVGGVGNGVFECVQDITGYENLCLMRYDDPDLYRALFARISDYLSEAWRRTLERWGHLFAVCRTGDDLGFRTQTLLPPEDIRALVIPGYRRIAQLVHGSGKPYLLHSCGCVFEVMDDIITGAGIDAKHSNEDQIAPFTRWLETYNDRIALFGGIDLNILYRDDEAAVRSAVRRLVKRSATARGYALGSGNSIPDDIPVDRYLAMVDEANRFRARQEG